MRPFLGAVVWTLVSKSNHQLATYRYRIRYRIRATLKLTLSLTIYYCYYSIRLVVYSVSVIKSPPPLCYPARPQLVDQMLSTSLKLKYIIISINTVRQLTQGLNFFVSSKRKEIGSASVDGLDPQMNKLIKAAD